MLPDYRYPVQATPAEIDAVALLMNDVGVASFMQYTPSASGTQGVFAYQALQKHFDYSAAYVTKAVEGPGRFAEILRQEQLNGCPVYLEGRPAGSASGHAWVTDGFDENGLFHMNFGWEGQGDAYYSLTNLNVSQTGSEFQGKPLAFNRAITAILAHPNNGKYPEIERGLLETSPQLMFNEGGSLSLKEASGKLFDPSQPVTVEMNSFVNRGKPFRVTSVLLFMMKWGISSRWFILIIISREALRKDFMAESRRDGWVLIILSIRLRKSVSVLPVLKTAITVSSLYVQPGRMMVHGMISCR